MHPRSATRPAEPGSEAGCLNRPAVAAGDWKEHRIYTQIAATIEPQWKIFNHLLNISDLQPSSARRVTLSVWVSRHTVESPSADKTGAARHPAGAALGVLTPVFTRFYHLALSLLPLPSLSLIPHLPNHLDLSLQQKSSVLLIPERNRKPGQSSKTEPGA